MSLVKIGIGGPVGSGKTKLVERLLPLFIKSRFKVCVVTNDLVTKEDSDRLKASKLIDSNMILGVETGACPHTAIREDPSINLEAVDMLTRKYNPDIILIESGGDNLAATFSAELVEYWIFVIDCSAGDDIPRKRGLGLLQSDLLLVNKIDLAKYVGANVKHMESDLRIVRGDRPWLFTNLYKEDGAEDVYTQLSNTILYDLFN